LVAGPRFAIYFVPAAETALYRFGAAVLGYDCYSGEDVAHPSDLGISETEWIELAQEPRSYGFHATLNAPFRLRPELDQAGLVEHVRTFAASRAPIAIEPAVGLLAGFVAIVPRVESPALDRLAADCVTAFDRFRLPMTAPERSRRLASGLSGRQIANLDRFGYPYVFEDFRFHMTLTGAIVPERRPAIHALLQAAFARRRGYGAVPIDRLALVRQDDPAARFRVIEHVRLGPPA
jgi:putative phosphonate metabolism protein